MPTQTVTAYTSAWKAVTYLPKGNLSLLTDSSHTRPLSPSHAGPIRNQTCHFTMGGVPVPVVRSYLVNAINLYMSSKL
jgi:hypothetical protein